MAATTLAEVLDQLAALHPKLIDLSLGRMNRLLDALGNPQKKLPPAIHIAGTNGKGSTLATMRAIADAAGLRVHCYTSPHLVHFNERIRLAGRLISDDQLLDSLTRVEAANAGEPITFFEVTTAAAFLSMSEVEADLALIEVGLGGRLDATNVLDTVAAAVITPIGMDHEEFLGDTIGKIASEKAGIIHSKCPVVVCSAQVYEAEAEFRHTARRAEAPLRILGTDFTVRPKGKTKMHYEDERGSLDLPRPKLKGAHQLQNAAVAIAALRAQTAVHIPTSAYKAGMGWVNWPARLQHITAETLVSALPKGSELWVDGGHNPAAGQAIRSFLKGYDPIERPIVVIAGMMGNKDAAGFLGPLATLCTRFIAVPVPGEVGGAAPATIAATASETGMRATVASGVPAALSQVAHEASGQNPPVVLITGSLYLAGDTLKRAGIRID